jgi:hypothetical protein
LHSQWVRDGSSSLCATFRLFAAFSFSPSSPFFSPSSPFFPFLSAVWAGMPDGVE